MRKARGTAARVIDRIDMDNLRLVEPDARGAALVPPGHAAFGAIAAGQRLRITDLGGREVGDLFAWTAGPVKTFQHMVITQMTNKRWRLRVGDVITGADGTPMWRIVEDTTGGTHLWGTGCCTREANVAAGVDQDGCTELAWAAMDALGIERGLFDQNIPANLFSSRVYLSDGRIVDDPPTTAPGASITFLALQDIVWAHVACPYPSVNVHGGDPTPHRVEVIDATMAHGGERTTMTHEPPNGPHVESATAVEGTDKGRTAHGHAPQPADRRGQQ